MNTQAIPVTTRKKKNESKNNQPIINVHFKFIDKENIFF
jgi:hypothetical protein